MYQKIKIATNGYDELQWLYSQDWEYYDYGNVSFADCKCGRGFSDGDI